MNKTDFERKRHLIIKEIKNGCWLVAKYTETEDGIYVIHFGLKRNVSLMEHFNRAYAEHMADRISNDAYNNIKR